MKKIVSVLVLLTVLLLLIGCGGTGTPPNDPNNPGENPSDNPSDPKTYTVTWVDENGEVLSSGKVEENKTPSYTYSVSDTAEWDFTFEGWASTQNGDVLSTLPSVTSDVTYYAQVSAVKQKYTVTFNTNGGSDVASQTVEYGAVATMPDAPSYENHKFIGWYYDENGNDAVDFNAPITSNVDFYAIWNEVANVKAMLSALLSGYKLNPMGYIPESMRYDFEDNLLDEAEIISDYSNSVNVSNIRYGYGEQWHMVMDNLRQTNTFFNVLSVVEGLSTTSITAFNNYFDKNPSDTAHHEFKDGIYNVTIDFDGDILYYVLDYTANLPALGQQTVQIALSMDERTGEKNVRLQIGDANALTYKIRENSYEFAIKYLGVRRAMFSIEKNKDGSVSGKIFEYLTVSSVEIGSSAEFYITDDYVSVVGNKASGMLGFTGYISELYNVDNGQMIGYEVQETLSKIVYNTLWFNLDDVSGINSIKYREVNGDIPAAFFVNGANTEWEAKTVGGVGTKMFSRRFDIEFRTQYVYSYDAVNEQYIEYAIKVPMLFVQEEYYNDFASDVKKTNDVTASITVKSADLNKLLRDYDELIPDFIESKDKITPEAIINYIGNKVTFEGES